MCRWSCGRTRNRSIRTRRRTIGASRNAVKAFRETGRNAVKAFRETGRNAVKAFRQTGRNAIKAFRQTGSRTNRRRAEDLLELVRSRDLQLVVAAVLRLLVRSPAQER